MALDDHLDDLVQDMARILQREFPKEDQRELKRAINDHSMAFYKQYPEDTTSFVTAMRVQIACMILAKGDAKDFKKRLTLSIVGYDDVCKEAESCSEEKYDAWILRGKPPQNKPSKSLYTSRPTQADLERIVRREFAAESVGTVLSAFHENLSAAEPHFSRLRMNYWVNIMPRQYAACIYHANGNVETLKRWLAIIVQEDRDYARIAEKCGEQRYEAWLKETKPHTVRHPTHEDVEVIVRREFSPDMASEVSQALGSVRYGELTPRIQAACIKMSNGDVDTLKNLAAATKGHWNILMNQATWDRQEYEAWLYRK